MQSVRCKRKMEIKIEKEAITSNSILMDNILVLFCITGFIGNVPAQSFKEGIDEFPSELGLVVGRAVVGFDITFEALYKIGNFSGGFFHD